MLDGYPSGVPVRDAKDLHDPALIFPADSWSSIVASVKTTELELVVSGGRGQASPDGALGRTRWLWTVLAAIVRMCQMI
ncbi:DUF397 domain-containing protein [Kitasatospora sp. NPDC088548]|uniref:DUF397 domain-containing protein n=1 Tax=Kitasatospora sp. NPDC088548 TaxID=3364075 RepID=UPI0037FA4798